MSQPVRGNLQSILQNWQQDFQPRKWRQLEADVPAIDVRAAGLRAQNVKNSRGQLANRIAQPTIGCITTPG